MNEISLELASYIKEATIVTLFEDYAKWLAKSGKVNSVATIKETLASAVSLALDRGDITQAMIEHIYQYIDDKVAKYMTEILNCHKRKFVHHVLREELPEVYPATSGIAADQDIIALTLKQKALDAEYAGICEKYSSMVLTYAGEFISAYSNMIDAEYVKLFV